MMKSSTIYNWRFIKRFLWWWNRTLKWREILSTFTKRHIYDDEVEKDEENDEEVKSVSKGKILDYNNKRSINENNSNESVEEATNKTMDQMAGDIIIASDREVDADFYIRGNPVSLYWSNIAVIMGGRWNVWRARDCGK